MNRHSRPKLPCPSPYPQSWAQVFTAILTGLVSLLAFSYLLDYLKGALP